MSQLLHLYSRPLTRSCVLILLTTVHSTHISVLGLRESSYSWLGYSVELFVEYSSTQLIPEMSINYVVPQNKRIPGSLFKFVIQQRLDMNQNNARNMAKILIKRGCNL